MVIEFIYAKLIGPINPKDPSQSLRFLVFILKLVGVYPPDSKKQWVQNIHAMYSILLRIIFLHIYAIFEAVYLLQISDISETAEAMFVFMTQVSLSYKSEIYFKNRFRLKAVVEQLQSDLYRPQTKDEEKAFKKMMLFEVGMHLIYASTPTIHMTGMATGAFAVKALLIPAWYPFETDTFLKYFIIYVYQVFGLALSACINVTYDMLGTALLLQAKLEVDRLGNMFAKVGHKDHEVKFEEPSQEVDDEMKEVNKMVAKFERSHSKVYAQMVKCIIFHKKLVDYIAELEDIFRRPVFCQFVFSTIIICMTMVSIVEKEHFADIAPFMAYLMGMTLEVGLYCWAGNEITSASDKLNDRIYFSDFTNFDPRTKRTMLFFMLRATNPIELKAGTIFQVAMSLETFKTLIQSAYSYFTLMRTLQEN